MKTTNTKLIRICLILVFFLPFLCFSCKSEKNLKIGFLLPNFIEDRYSKEKQYFSEKIKALGGEAFVLSGENNDALQIKQAADLIGQGIKVLVVDCINKHTAAEIVRYAQSNNVKVIAYERIIDNCAPDYFISFNNVKIGELMADYAVQRKPTGNYFLLCGDKSDQNALWVKEGYMKVLGNHISSGKITIVYNTFIENWSADNAEFEMDQYLRLSNNVPDVILSAYDGLSYGAIRAMERNQITSLPIITGQNAELEACRNILSKKQSMTIFKGFKAEAEMAAEMAIKIAEGKELEIKEYVSNGSYQIPSILLDPVTVDSTNLKDVLINSKHLNINELYN